MLAAAIQQPHKQKIDRTKCMKATFSSSHLQCTRNTQTTNRFANNNVKNTEYLIYDTHISAKKTTPHLSAVVQC